MLDLNELSINSSLHLLEGKEKILNALNLKRLLKTRFKKSLLMVTAAVGLVSVFGSVVVSSQDCSGNGYSDVHSAVKCLVNFQHESLEYQRTTDLWKGDVSQRLDVDNQKVDTALQTLTNTFTEQLNGHIQILKSAQDALKMDIAAGDSALKSAVADTVAKMDLKHQDIHRLLHHMNQSLLYMNQSFYETLAVAQNTSHTTWQERTNQLDTRLQQTERRLSVRTEPIVTLPFLMGAFFTGMAGVKLSTHWVPLNDAAKASGCFVPQKYLHTAYGLYAISILALEQATWNVVGPLMPSTATDFTHGSVFLLSAATLYGLHQSGERITPHLTLRNSLLLSGLGIVGAYTFQDYVCMFLPCWISKIVPEEWMHYKGRGVERNYTTALGLFAKAAEQGLPKAQVHMGEFYHYGYGVPQDYTLAAEWARKAAEQGFAEGQADLGSDYYYGYGNTQNYTLAAEWVRKAAEQGYAKAQEALGRLHYNGHGVPKDYDLAAQWYAKAKAIGMLGRMQCYLGQEYEKGRNGAFPDYIRAIELYTQAAGPSSYEKGESMYRLGVIYKEGREGIPQDYKLAEEWLEKSSKKGNEPAQLELFDMYAKGLGDLDYQWVVSCVTGADPQYKISVMYKEGRGVPQDYKLAAEWLGKASKSGSENAQLDLFDMYAKGKGDVDYRRVINCITRADPQYKIGMIYKEGRDGVPQDYKLAAEWLEKAVTQNHCQAQSLLGEMYQEGLGVPQDDAKAAEWLMKAAACK